jgi:superfamily I DNA/RNA helicase
MLGRVAALVGAHEPLRVVGGTFHSVAYRLLRRHSAALGLGDSLTVIDSSDVADLIDVVRAEGGEGLSLVPGTIGTMAPWHHMCAPTPPGCRQRRPEPWHQ